MSIRHAKRKNDRVVIYRNNPIANVKREDLIIMLSIMRKYIVMASIPALLLWAMAVPAHHSATQFDLTSFVTLEGVVKSFIVKNPHTTAVIEVTDAKGTRDIEFEGHSASHFYRAGYTRDLVHVGDRIAILISPRKDGKDGGFLQAFTVNGRTVGLFGLAPETGKGADQK